MTALPMTRKQDELTETGPLRPLDHSFFWGVWQNTNAHADGIVRVKFFDQDGALAMQVFGAGEAGLVDWGVVTAQPLADTVASREGTKFAANYDFEFMQVRMHGWVKLGVLVIAVFNRFNDGSGRANYFDREFFHAVEENVE